MKQPTVLPNRADLPDTLHSVLTEAAERRAAGVISQDTFQSFLERLVTDELQPRGYSLLVRDLADGHTRFLIKESNGSVCDLIDCACGSGAVSAA